MLGADYIDTFLSSHHPYDYAREHIVYPRRPIYREYDGKQIAALRRRVPFSKKPIPLRPCRPSLLQYHLRESSNDMVDGYPWWHIETEFVSAAGEEIEKIYGTRWILVSYYDDAFVNFMQLDFDRHAPEDTDVASRQVALLKEAARHYEFDILWTTSPGYLDCNREAVHGLYAWIRLDQNHFVMDIKAHVEGFLHSVGLGKIADEHEGAYLKKKKLVRLPGQFNVELADPDSFSKIYQHTPLDAVRVFQEAWAQAKPMRSEVLTSFAPPTPQRSKRPAYTQCSVTPSPLPPHGDTFEALLKWGRAIVNQHYPDESKTKVCVSELIATAQEKLPSISRTRRDGAVLRHKAEGVIRYLWSHTDAETVGRTRADEEDARRFRPHAGYIQDHRSELLDKVPHKLRIAADRILDLLLERNGRVAAVSIYHDKKTPICTHRNWKRIQECWQLTTLVEYSKPVRGKGKCKQWGFACVGQQENVSADN